MSLALVVAIKTISQPNQMSLLIHTVGVEFMINETISFINLNYISQIDMMQVYVHVCNLEMLDKKHNKWGIWPIVFLTQMSNIIHCKNGLESQYVLFAVVYTKFQNYSGFH